MVVKLEGTLNGSPIVFERKEGDWWETTVPKIPSGTYAVWLVATDDAGNKGYATKYLLTINLNQMCVHLEPFPWKAEILCPDYCAKLKVSNYYAELMSAECGGCG